MSPLGNSSYRASRPSLAAYAPLKNIQSDMGGTGRSAMSVRNRNVSMAADFDNPYVGASHNTHLLIRIE